VTARVLARARPGSRERDGSVFAGVWMLADQEYVEISVDLSPAEAAIVRARIADPAAALELTKSLEALPEQFAIGLAGDEVRAPASSTSTGRLRELLDRAEREQRTLRIGWSVPRDAASAGLPEGRLLEEQLEGAAAALGAVVAVLAPQLGRSAARSHARSKKRGPASKPAEDGTSPAPPGRGRNLGDRVFEKGARVRVLEGPFSGKVGIVHEADAKGGVRVMLGLIAVRVDVRDLARFAEGRSRPVLSTSHRKPRPES
jgi:hypothetical protein